jgi:tetratricopeptide (TPR) repeat protein
VLDSQEYDEWARRIVAGDLLGRGTFFQAPLYPYFLAILYFCFGPAPSGVYLVQVSGALIGCAALFFAGRILGGERLGLAAASLFAVFPTLIFFDVQVAKESLAVTAAASLLALLLIGRARAQARFFFLAGLACGALILLRENTLLIVPLLLVTTWQAGAARASLRSATGLLAGICLLLLPVTLRNGLVGGSFLPTTFQAGTNLFIGNNPEADGTYKPIVRGKQIPRYEREEPYRLAEEALGRQLKASEVSRYWIGRTWAWARAEPWACLRLQARKLGLFWSPYEQPDALDFYYVRTLSPFLRLGPEFGGLTLLALVGAWLRRRQLWRDDLPITLFVIGWTASTVIFFIFSRYRIPIAPALMLWAAAPLVCLIEAWQTRQRRAAALWTGLLITILIVPRFATPEPSWNLVNYNLGVIHLQAGEFPEAEARFARVVEKDPKNFLATLNLGTLAARRRDDRAALAWLESARALNPESDDAEASLGTAHFAAGRLEEARRHLERALELNSRHGPALHNLALIALKAGRSDDARALNTRLLALDPQNPAALQLRKKISGPNDALPSIP